MVERQLELSLNILRTHGGGEYNLRELKQYCAKKGIEHEITILYTPQHNDLAEKRNKTC